MVWWKLLELEQLSLGEEGCEWVVERVLKPHGELAGSEKSLGLAKRANRHRRLSTPNVEYNARFESLPAGKFRHKDHRFEWTRAEFHDWSQAMADRFGYRVRFLPVGPEDNALGAPTQMAVFNREQAA
jgi:hypothetical protein